jgi:uncharacterized protein YjbI with pentapeptide repeats
MGQYTFAGIWYFNVPESNYLAPHGANFALYEFGGGNGKDPANSYNVYSTPKPGEYIFQSQLNGMYVGMTAGSGLVSASFSDPAQAQPLIPTPYQDQHYNITILYLPDKVHFLGARGDGAGWAWQIDIGGNYLYNDGGLQPTSWNFSEILAGKGTGGFTLKYANLTDCVFPPGTDLRGVNFSGANLTGATFTGCTLDGAFLTNCNLTNTHFVGSTTLLGTHLEGATFQGTVLSNTRLAGAVFKQSDLTGVIANPPPQFYNTPLAPPSATNPRTSLAGCRLDQSLVANDWSMLDLTGATILNLPSPLSSQTKPLKATYAILKGLNQNNLVGLSLQNSVFDHAVLDGLGLNTSGSQTSDLTGASFIQASMHGTNLTGAILKGANMSGAQLGRLSQRFALETSFEHDLNAGPVDAALRGQFSQHDITLSESATLTIPAPSRVWQLNDLGNKYTIRLETKSDNTQVLTVYAEVASASLVHAYMPDAVLTGANLYGVLASGAQFYGSNARLDGSAILEGVEFIDANLSNLNLTQANLLGAILSGAQLFNAKFNKANLGPSASAVANLSDANLQGADFTDAQLYGANLSNAAVAVKVPTRAIPSQGGVYLFSLPYATDTKTLQQYTAELNAAASKFSLNPGGDQAKLEQYVSALKANNLAPLKSAFLSHQPPIILSDNAQIQTVEVGDIWQIVDGAQSYTLWTDPDQTELYAAPSLTKTHAAFHHNTHDLRWQASVAVDTAGQQWLLDNDSENPQNFSPGYVKFIVQLNGSVLDVYGTAVRIERLVDDNQLQPDTETCNLTAIAVTNMNSETICPNGTALGVNQNTGGVQWDTKWLRAASPPKPPTCVPTDYSWCPVTATSTQSAPDFGGDVCPDFNTALN